jgi:hypothetical protein
VQVAPSELGTTHKLSEEHYRRSETCSFFVFAQSSRKHSKRAYRSKKSRVSKGSRLSTQSTTTIGSEAPTIDSDDTLEQSTLSQSTATTTKTRKKLSRARTKKGTKNEPKDVSSQMDQDSNDGKQSGSSKPRRGPRGKKRLSYEISKDSDNQLDGNSVMPLEPPAKRRALSNRNSIAQQPIIVSAGYETEKIAAFDEISSMPGPKKGRNPPKGRARGRKPSATSNASKISLRSRVPDSSMLDPALETNSEREMVNTDNNQTELHHNQMTRQEEERRKSTHESTASVPSVRATQQTNGAEEPETSREDIDTSILKTDLQRVKTNPEAANEMDEARGTAMGPMNSHKPADSRTTDESTVPERHDSLIANMDTVNEAAAKAAAKANPVARKTKRVGKASKTKNNPIATGIEDEPLRIDGPKAEDRPRNDHSLQTDQQGLESSANAQQQTVDDEGARRTSRVPPKTAERYSDIPQDQHRTQSFLGLLANEDDGKQKDTTQDANRPARTRSLSQPAQENTPSPSPQSSNAENQPPSVRPSTSRPPIVSPSKGQVIRVPLAASTPSMSPSKRQGQTAFLTSYPWTLVDVDEFFATLNDKGNSEDIVGNINGDLTSPEKRMTVEEWIRWNARNGEEKLRTECERLVTGFEKEGGRAMRTLEGIKCVD